MAYESPIKIMTDQIQLGLEGEVMKAVQKVGIDVDKTELIRALQYDRYQYMAGHKDGLEEGEKAAGRHAHWVLLGEKQIHTPEGRITWATRIACSSCREKGWRPDGTKFPKYCAACGARMDEEVTEQ